MEGRKGERQEGEAEREGNLIVQKSEVTRSKRFHNRLGQRELGRIKSVSTQLS